MSVDPRYPLDSATKRPVKAGLEVFPIAIGVYDHHEKLDVDTEVTQVVQLLAEFGGREVPWPAAMADRGADAVDSRLQAWARPEVPADSVLYWVGHGWSDGLDVALAHARSPAPVRSSGLLPAQLAEPLRARQATAAGRWAMVILDTCWSSRFVDKVNAELAEGVLGADAVLLVGVSGDGAASLGRFTTAFRACLQENFRADRKIELWRLVHELDRRLPHGLVTGRRLTDAALDRGIVPVAATISVPLDVLHELEEIIARLSDDERRHFLLKAQGAEEGELCWFFEGRVGERGQIVDWLRATDSGLLTVTGRAGSGKSALLGHVLVHSLPDLRGVLARAGLVDPLPENELPPDGVFDEVIHLTGVTLTGLVRRIALASGLGEPPSLADPAAGLGAASDLDWLVEGLRQRIEPFTLLVDALDEADDPLAVARTVLRRLAAVPGVRILVGTRASTKESPDHPEQDDHDLLAALDMDARISESPLVWVVRDDEAVVRYVIRRLTIARDRGTLAIHGRSVSSDAISGVAEIVGRQQREFLFARLAVYEVLADPALLGPALETTLIHLLAGDHRDLFAAAVTRLATQSASFLPLLEALALARGRGIPVLDGIWALMATALTDPPRGDVPEVGVITDADISALLADAQPYIAVDFEAGQTVYRLAHRTFAEYFLTRWERS